MRKSHLCITALEYFRISEAHMQHLQTEIVSWRNMQCCFAACGHNSIGVGTREAGGVGWSPVYATANIWTHAQKREREFLFFKTFCSHPTCGISRHYTNHRLIKRETGQEVPAWRRLSGMSQLQKGGCWVVSGALGLFLASATASSPNPVLL